MSTHAIRMRPDPPGEEVLIGRARDGDVRALEALYRIHADDVYGLCLRMVGDERRAEELAQDAWVRAWDQLSTFGGRSAFGTWLYRVTTNVVLQSERSRRRRTRVVSDAPLPGLDTVADVSGGGASAAGDRAVDRIALERAIAALPPRARAVLVLHDLRGHTHREIAAILGIAEGTSRAHLFFARERMRRRLGP